MTSWGIVIVVGALFFGLRDPQKTRHAYASVFVVVVVALLYAALKQHAY